MLKIIKWNRFDTDCKNELAAQGLLSYLKSENKVPESMECLRSWPALLQNKTRPKCMYSSKQTKTIFLNNVNNFQFSGRQKAGTRRSDCEFWE